MQVSKLKLGIDLSKRVGLDGPYLHQGPLPDHDHCGYEVAIQELLYSLRPGKHSSTHCQFDTIRRLRTVFGNHYRSTPQATTTTVAMGQEDGSYQRLYQDPCASVFFSAFQKGIKYRMGQIWKPNRAFSVELLLKFLGGIEEKIDQGSTGDEIAHWITIHTYVVVAYALSLRGTAALYLDLGGLLEHWKTMNAHLIIALRGKVKGEHQERNHLFPCVFVTSSGIDLYKSLERCLKLKKVQGRLTGPLISDSMGACLSTREIDGSIHEILDALFVSHRALFPADVCTIEHIHERYHAFRSFRRSSDTRAVEMEVAQLDIDVVNRWKSVERAKGRRPGMNMNMHYAQMEELLNPFIRYTRAM